MEDRWSERRRARLRGRKGRLRGKELKLFIILHTIILYISNFISVTTIRNGRRLCTKRGCVWGGVVGWLLGLLLSVFLGDHDSLFGEKRKGKSEKKENILSQSCQNDGKGALVIFLSPLYLMQIVFFCKLMS